MFCSFVSYKTVRFPFSNFLESTLKTTKFEALFVAGTDAVFYTVVFRRSITYIKTIQKNGESIGTATAES